MKEEFSGDLKDLISYMIQNDSDSCELITTTIQGFSVTAEITIKKIIDGETIIYAADELVSEAEEIKTLEDYKRDKYLS